MSTRRHVLSTHLIRVRARAKRRHYMRLQSAARADCRSPAYGQLFELRIATTDVIRVERATHERGKWVVVAVPAASASKRETHPERSS